MTGAAARRAAVALGLAAALLLAACTPTQDYANPGYVSGDGTVTEWAPADRSDAVEVAGTTYAGDELSLADLRGEVVVVTTWYAACPPCRAEAPRLVAIDARDGVRVVGINSRDDAGAAQAFQRTFDVTFPSIDDADGRAIASLQGLVALNAVPTTLVLDRDGRVAARIIGLADAAVLGAIVDGLEAE